MKLTLIGAVNPTFSYQDWENLFNRYFPESALSEIAITGSDTLLNRYAKTYADKFAIPVSVYDISDDSAETRLRRNKAMIENSDLLVAFTTGSNKTSLSEGISISPENEKKALILNTGKEPGSTTNHTHDSGDEMISIEEELALVAKISQSAPGCDEAIERLKRFYRRFVDLIAAKYVSADHPWDKLIAEGNIGLIHAARQYDPACGFKFVPYAVYWIRQSIKEAVGKL